MVMTEMLESISQKLQKHCEKEGLTFTVRSSDCSLGEAFADFGVLPGLFKRADKYAKLCEGSATGATYKDDKKTVLGYRVSLDKPLLSEPIMLLYLLDALLSIVEASDKKEAVALDQLTYE